MSERLLERGDREVATLRQPGALDDLRTWFGADQLMVERLDVTELGEVQRVVDEAFECAGRIDIVVNNAGYGLYAAIEEPTRDPGLAKQFPGQVEAPPLKPKKDAAPEEAAAYEEQRHQQSSERICVEHANAEHKQWRPLQRYLRRREHFDETFLAISGLVSDRAAAR